MKEESGREENRAWRVMAATLLLMGVAFTAVASEPLASAPAVPGVRTPDLPMPGAFFTENSGQVKDQGIRFYSSGEVAAGFAESAIVLKLLEDRSASSPVAPSARDRFEREDPAIRDTPAIQGVLVRVTFEGSNRVLPEGMQEMSHRSNYFLGSDPSAWRTGVRSYRELRYENLYEGINLLYRIQDGRLKYDFIVAPGADLSIIRMAYEGVEGLRVEGGELLLTTGLGDLREQEPFAFQGEREVACAFVPRGPLAVGFACEGQDASRSLVIDPLIYATYLGGGDDDRGFAIAVDASGSAYVTGQTLSTDFPATPGAFNTTYSGNWDAIVVKLNATGTGLVYATYLGGGDFEDGRGIAVDVSGNAYVAGTTTSSDFPATPGANDTTLNAGLDAFVAKLNATGTGLAYATYLGGGSFDEGYSIAIDVSGSAYVTGRTRSTDFPATPGAFDTTFNGLPGNWDGFVAKLDAAGSVFTYVTYLGGDADDHFFGIAADASGNAFVTGDTHSADFPATLGAYDTTLNGTQDAFVAKLNATGSGLSYATYLGGGDDEYAYSIAADASGSAFVTGTMFSSDFPTTPGAYDPTFNGIYDAFVTKLNASGNGLDYSTHLGGGGDDVGYGIAVDTSGTAFVTGTTSSGDFPATAGAYDTVLGGTYDAFVAKLDATGGALPYATFLGGGVDDVDWGIAIDASGMAYVTGRTSSTDFPATPGAYDTITNGNYDTFVAKLDLTSTSASPVLGATGEADYLADGLDPETGTLATSFAYRVMYTDADDDLPAAGDPRVHVLRGAVEISGSPFTMTEVDALDVDVTDGKLYAFATTLSARATNYTYYFNASDDAGNAAPDWPSAPADAPDVLNRAPTADAGPDQPGRFTNATVTLDGTGSGDLDVDALTFSWTQAAGPVVVLTESSTDAPSFTPTLPGTYTFDLLVDDGWAANDTDSVNVTVANVPLTANAGQNQQNVTVGTTVTLNGTQSTDPEGDTLSYSWVRTSGPAAIITNADTATPTFTPTVAGTYVFTLTVSDGTNTATDTVTITVVEAVAPPPTPPDNTLLIVGAGLAIVVVLVLVVLLAMRKRKKPEEKAPGTEGAPGKPG